MTHLFDGDGTTSGGPDNEGHIHHHDRIFVPWWWGTDDLDKWQAQTPTMRWKPIDTERHCAIVHIDRRVKARVTARQAEAAAARAEGDDKEEESSSSESSDEE